MFVLLFSLLDVSVLISERAMYSLPSNYWTNCWYICPSFDPTYLYSVAHLSLMIIYSQFFKVFSHTLCLPVQICSFSRANSVSPFHFPLFFSLLTPLIVYSFSYNVRSHHIQTFPLSPLVSLLYFFSVFLSSSLDAHISLLSSAFLSF